MDRTEAPQSNAAFYRWLLLPVAAAAVVTTFLVRQVVPPEQEDTRAPEPLIIAPIAVFPDFVSIDDIPLKKRMFFEFMELYIVKQNELVADTRESLLAMSDILSSGTPLGVVQREELVEIAARYRLDFEGMRESEVLFELLKRVDTIPVSLALAQAANESAWGTSRFALEGNNIFGQWCYDEGCGLVPNRRANEASHEVRAFISIEASVRAYFMNLNTHHRYESFREMRFQMRNQRGRLDPMVLAYGLHGYSERGQKYVDEVQSIIKQNDLLSRYQS